MVVDNNSAHSPNDDRRELQEQMHFFLEIDRQRAAGRKFLAIAEFQNRNYNGKY